ncbi:ATP-dependent DNA ligase [compost metagenome]
MPLSWDELGQTTGGAQWTISNVQARLEVANSPRDDYTPQTITKAMKAIGHILERAKGWPTLKTYLLHR